MEKSKNKMVTILIPTMNKKTDEDIIKLCEKMNISSNAVIANQCGKESKTFLNYKGHEILVIGSKDVGVSKNRNLLMENAYGKYGIFMDDDGVMNDGYVDVIINEFAKTRCKWIKFNISIIETAKRETNTLCTKRGIASYKSISQYGMPGFAFRIDEISKKYRFDEMVGTPNYIFHGEDSLFIHDLFKKERIFCSDQILGSIFQNESTWFSKYNDQYYITQGYLYKKMHGFMACLYILRMYLKKRKMFNESFIYIYKKARIGFKLLKANPSDQLNFVQKELENS